MTVTHTLTLTWSLAVALLCVPTIQAQRADGDDFFLLRKNLEIFGEAYAVLTEEYADPLDPQRIVRDGLGAFLGELDPYTVLLDEATLAQGALLRSTYGLVGVTLERRGGELVVGPPDEGTSTGGYAQGLRVGDRVVTIAGRDVRALPLTEAATLLSGEPGTTVTISVERPGEDEAVEFVLTREDPSPISVPFSGFIGDDTTRGMGYVRLTVFGSGAGQEMRSAVTSLAQRELDGLVLDLRGNGGGLLGAAVEIVGLFVPTGTNVTTLRMRDPSKTETYRTTSPPVAPDVPIVVLVDSLSASASEIVSGALQDLDRAVIVGDQTFGKGLVQVVRRLPYNTALKLTVGRYELPSGRVVQRLDYGTSGSGAAIAKTVGFTTTSGRAVTGGSGVTPDVMGAEPDRSALEAALLRGAWFFRYADRFETQNPTLPNGWRRGLLDDFRSFLDSEGFAYESDAGDLLADLRGRLQAAGYSDALGETDRVVRALSSDQQRDFDRHADALERRLVGTIRPRYGVTRGPSVDIDPNLQQALDLLADPAAYAGALGR